MPAQASGMSAFGGSSSALCWPFVVGTSGTVAPGVGLPAQVQEFPLVGDEVRWVGHLVG